MGKTMMGGTTRQDDVSMLTPEQQQLFSSILSQLGPGAIDSLGGLMGPMGEEEMQNLFQKSYVDPAMQTFEQQTVPGIQQRFADVGAGSSSALNQALAQGASDLSTSMGSQYGQFMQGQQGTQLNAISQFLPMITGQTFSPQFQQQQGMFGPMMQAAGRVGAGAVMSSRTVKENIKKYKKGLKVLMNLDVNQYDYIEEVGGLKDKVGLIAEDVPKELTANKDGILHVDLYGVMGLLINAVKELSKKVEKLEAN